MIMLKERRDIPKKDPDGSSGGGDEALFCCSVSVLVIVFMN